jgi:hypothetical protein
MGAIRDSLLYSEAGHMAATTYPLRHRGGSHLGPPVPIPEHLSDDLDMERQRRQIPAPGHCALAPPLPTLMPGPAGDVHITRLHFPAGPGLHILWPPLARTTPDVRRHCPPHTE